MYRVMTQGRNAYYCKATHVIASFAGLPIEEFEKQEADWMRWSKTIEGGRGVRRPTG